MNRATDPAPTTGDELDRHLSEPDTGVIAAVRSCSGPFTVLGAGGKMGLHVCQMLRRALQALGREDSVLAVSRFSSPQARTLFTGSGIEVIAADLSDPDAYAPLPTAGSVVYLAGVKFGTSSSPELLQQMNVTMPRYVAEHFRHSRIVALSTGCVYPFTTPQSGGSTEDDPADPPGDYAQSCLGREQAFTQASLNYQTPCALVRLNYSIELRYGVLVDIAQQVFAGQPVNIETGYVNVIWQRDAVSQIIRCLPLAASPPMILNVTGSDILSVRELAERFGQAFDKPVKFQGTEAPTAWLSNNRRAVAHFGEPRTNIDTMIHWIAQWIAQGGPLLGKPTHFESRDGAF